MTTTYANGLIPLAELTPLSVGGHLRADAAASFERWRAAADRAGRVLTITSAGDAYRNRAAQERVFFQRYAVVPGNGPYGDVRRYGGRRYVRVNGPAAAVPGTSNHGWATTIDVRNAGPFGGSFHNWLLATGPEHGWSNDEGRSVNEPWHWVYNPANDKHRTTGGASAARPEEEEDMPLTDADIQRIWGYRNPKVETDDAYAVLRSARDASTKATALDKKLSGVVIDARDGVLGNREIAAQIVGLKVAVETLAKSQGLDPKAITAAVDAGVKSALTRIETTVTVKPGSN